LKHFCSGRRIEERVDLVQTNTTPMAFFLHAARRKETGVADPDFTPPVFPEEPIRPNADTRKKKKKQTTFDTEAMGGDDSSQDLMDQVSKLAAALNTSGTETFSLNLGAPEKPKRKFATRGQTTSNTTLSASTSKPKEEKKDPLESLSHTIVSTTSWSKAVPVDTTKYNMSKRGALSLTESLEDETKRVKAMGDEERAKVFRLGNRLISVAKQGDVKRMKKIVGGLSKGMLTQWSACKAFVAAVESSHLNVVRFLMANGVHPVANPGVAKALHVAVTHKCSNEMLTFLVLAGFNVNETVKPQDFTPLHVACATKNAVAVECLLSLGADPNAVASDAYDSMPLTLATKVAKDTVCADLIRKAGGRLTWRKQPASVRAASANVPNSTTGNGSSKTFERNGKIYATAGGSC
jgi:hypothetical protein